jgi:DNA-binding NtrC family response regulator
LPRPVVLIVGGGGPTGQRLRAHLARRGLLVRTARDCGSADEILDLSSAHPPQSAGGIGAVVLDVDGAGVGAGAFREFIQQEYPGILLMEMPDGQAGPEDVGLLVAAVEQGLRGMSLREEAGTPGADPEAEEGFETPFHGYKFEDLNSRNPAMLELFHLSPRFALSDSPVLIVGETGTGKELVAAAIHRQSRRKAGEFFTINCGALTETLLESELFGHEQGAFTGAVKAKQGYFELASGGTLFLDELGTISHGMQVKLLRVLQNMEIRRVGGTAIHNVDVRIVAATNASLEDEVAAGTFREDLYYRLNVVQLQIPPLRDRPDDIPLLADIFSRKFATSLDREDVAGIEARALQRLTSYAWPGNVRELENVIQRALILTKGPQIVEADLPMRLCQDEARQVPVPAFDLEEPLLTVVSRVRDAVEREYLKRLLRRYRGHLGRAAEHAGVNRRTLYSKMQLHGLRREDFR